MDRLNVLFLHSSKFDYKELLYKPILSNKVCLKENVILPESSENSAKYIKDLIKTVDIVFIDISERDFLFDISLKWALKYNDNVIFITSMKSVYHKYRKYYKFDSEKIDFLPIIERELIKTKKRKQKNEEVQVIGEI